LTEKSGTIRPKYTIMRQNINKKVKLVCLYQVVMHYRLPFYNKISQDPDIDFVLIHGNGNKKGKLVNANLDKALFKRIQLNDYRIPMPFSPLLMFHLIKESPDIVFTEGSSSLINSSIAFIYSKLFNKKFIWWSLGKLKNKQYTGFRKLINKWERYIELHSNAIFTYSTQGKEYFLSRGVDRSKIYVAGDGELLNKLKDKTNKYNIRNVKFTGNLLPEDIPCIMSSLDLLLLPSLNEGMPRVTLEALALGVPVIGSNVGGIPESIGEENCFDLDEKFVKNISTRALEILVNKEKPKGLSKEFYWESTLEKEINVYNRILNC
jgi:glycosyltransferase involved in cell wall biosynthesis